jgi:hypothetical protein
MLHSNAKWTWSKTIVATVLFLTTCSFAAIAGGDTYEIYLNKKLVFKQIVHNASAIDLNSLQLTKDNYNDELVIYYSHCGVTGTGRSIEIKDDQNNVLKEWKYNDAVDANAAMTIPVKEILELQKKNPKAALNLYYFSSKYLPKGRMLASIKTQEKNTVMIPGRAWSNEAFVAAANIAVKNFLLWRI